MKELEAMPPCGKSSVVTGMSFTGPERIIGTGDMWPLTWADDDNIYAAAGDNSGFRDHFQPMNLWKVEGTPPNHEISLVNDLSFITADGRDPESDILPIKPAGVVSVDGILYLAVEDMRYTQGRYGNQVNLQAWMLTSTDHGRTWSEPPKPGSAERRFFTGVFASPHFLQFGRDYSGAPDDWVYAYSSAGDDGVAAWSAGDFTFLARVPRRRILDCSAWEFCAGTANGVPLWSKALEKAAPVFTYPRKTGENEVVYHPGLGRYLLLNWAFIDCVNHMLGSLHSELSVFESEHPWGPWAIVHVIRDWGQNCDYQPRLPTKWIDPRTGAAWLVSAGNFLKRGGRFHYAFVAAPVAFKTGDYGDIDTSGRSLPVLGDFAAEALSESEIHLSWLPVQGAGFYRVSRDGRKRKDISPQYPSEFIEKGLAPLESHTWSVTAFSPAGTVLAASGTLSKATLARPDGRSLGVNFGTSGFVVGTTVWCGERSEAHFSVSSAWAYIDDRIRTLRLRPDPAGMEPALRSFRGGVPGVKVTFRDPPGRRLDIRVIVVEPHLSHAPSRFDVWVNGVLVERYESSLGPDANWCVKGPFAVTLREGEELVVEGRHFTGLGGIAAIRIDAVEEQKATSVVD